MATTPIEYQQHGFWVDEFVLATSLMPLADYMEQADNDDSKKLSFKIQDIKEVAKMISWGGGVLVIEKFIRNPGDKAIVLSQIRKCIDTLVGAGEHNEFIAKAFTEHLAHDSRSKMKVGKEFVSKIVRTLIYLELLCSNLLNIKIETHERLYMPR